MGILNSVFSIGANRDVKRYRKVVDKINKMEPWYERMTEEELVSASNELRKKARGENSDDAYIVENAFALLRENIKRRSGGKRAYDVQLIGALALYEGRIAELKTGEGKAQTVDTKIPTPEGWKLAGDIKIGDLVFDAAGHPTRILGVFPQGKRDVYRVTLSDGRSVEVADDHLWEALDNYAKKTGYTTYTTECMLNKGLTRPSQGKNPYRWFIPMNSAAVYPEKKYFMAPYAMGAFLGDGCRSVTKALVLSSEDAEIPNRVAELLSCEVVKNHENNHSWTFMIETDSAHQMGTRFYHGTVLHSYEVDSRYEDLLSNCYAHEKYIPEEYKLGSIEQRWELVRGLMDTDGNIYGVSSNENPNCGRFAMQFSTTSPKLRDDFMEVLYSLGVSCTWSYGKRVGAGAATHDQFVVHINVDNDMKSKFFSLRRKKELACKAPQAGHKRHDYTRVAISNIEKLDEQKDMVCFYVDNPRHLYLCSDYIVTHNTIVSHFPTFVKSLYGKQSHVITVNEYLTLRDAEEALELMGNLGVTVGRIYNQQLASEKKKAYLADIVYGTPAEFGFDYLRDNMVASYDDKVQKRHDYVLIDEVDSVLIDEARTPLIISGEGTTSSNTYSKFAKAVRNLVQDEDYKMEEDKKQIAATENGLIKIEQRLGFKIYDDMSGTMANHLMQALKAEYLWHRDKDYIVADNEVKIVDENTGRIMEGRRWSEGLHQAIEAKEGVKIQDENKTLATITLQNYFRIYEQICGMTGTALTESAEFREVYGIETVSVPTNRPVIREDETDVIYATEQAKYDAVVDEIERAHANGQPCLVGTISVENSEKLSRLLTKRGLKHTVLNAKYHAKEAEIVAQAGRLGAITIATNMAGRGTDIILGGNVSGLAKGFAEEAAHQRVAGIKAYKRVPGDELPTPEEKEAARAKAQAIYDDEHPKVIEAGGLYVIGSERHNARRIDNQLRGRSGRQGDPGRSRFFISLEDDLMKLFGDNIERIKNMLMQGDYDPSIPIDMPMVSKAIESAQHKIEKINYEQRKHTLEYDDVINKQRSLIYRERDSIMLGEDLSAKRDDVIDDEIEMAFEENQVYSASDWSKVDWRGLATWYQELTGKDSHSVIGRDMYQNHADMKAALVENLTGIYESKRSVIRDNVENADEAFQDLQGRVMLFVIDNAWQGHLTSMDYLRAGIGLRGVGQRDPLVEYKQEAFRAFQMLVDQMYHEYLTALFHLSVTVIDPNEHYAEAGREMTYTKPAEVDGEQRGVGEILGGELSSERIVGADMGHGRTYRKDPSNPYANVGRNQPCPCGSGKKFKNCHGKNR